MRHRISLLSGAIGTQERAGRPARAWHTLFDAVLKAGDRFDFFLLDEALKSYGEELFPDPQERLEWCIRTAIGLERWDEAKPAHQ